MTQKAEFSIDWMQEATVADVAQIAAACFSIPWTEGAYRRELQNPQAITLVATEHNAVLGFINCGFVAGELTINALAVLPQYRRTGVASALMKAVFAWTQALCDVCYLEVRESNLAAQKLYQSLGFVQNGYRANYYQQPTEAAVLMMKVLSKTP